MDELKYVVELAPITKKNSTRIMQFGKVKKVVPSAQFINYQNNASVYLLPKPEKPIDYPVQVKCLFYMPTRRRVDLTNLLEAIDDILVRYGILEDDHSRIIVSHDGSRVLYDKENPRTEVSITPYDILFFR